VNAIPRLLEDTAAASAALRLTRERTRVSAVAAIRRLERALVEALDGETLKGLREIAPGYSAARVRGSDDSLPEPKTFEAYGRSVLVVDATGDLVMATRRRVGGVCVRRATDEDLLLEDVESVARVFTRVLTEHVERARRSAEKFDALDVLARKIVDALG
jgi:hypothetical protein